MGGCYHPFMNVIVLIIAAAVWLSIEGLLLLRDRTRSKGSTKIDRLTRLFNIITVALAVCSPLLLFILPTLRFAAAELPAVTWIGTVVVGLGLFLRYWSIIVLGVHFRTTVELDPDQPIVRKGPYRFIRHPSYSGIILFCSGYGLVSQHWLAFAIAVVLPTAALLYRIKVEEAAFVREMGEAYQAYQSKTKKLIPGIW
jgi:protein-S-isoprenylcysteine O-methyltransferase Ste14